MPSTAPAAPSAIARTAPSRLRITIDRAEGPSVDCFETVHTTWVDAETRCAAICASVEPGGGYDKCDVLVSWGDNDSYATRYDANGKAGTLAGYILASLLFRCGRMRPRHMSAMAYAESWRRYTPAEVSEVEVFLAGHCWDDSGRAYALPPLADLSPIDLALYGDGRAPPVGARVVGEHGPCSQRFGTLVRVNTTLSPHHAPHTVRLVAWDDGTTGQAEYVRPWMAKQGIGTYWDHFRPLASDAEVSWLLTLALEHDAAEKAKRNDKEATHAAKLDKGRAIWSGLFPSAQPVALIVARNMRDDSDSQSDYFASHPTVDVALCVSSSKRNSFTAFRKAARLYAETANLATDGVEHREDYSMGGGTYLSGSQYSKASGWEVRLEAIGPRGPSDAVLMGLVDVCLLKAGA